MNDYLRSLNPAVDPPNEAQSREEPPAIIAGSVDAAPADPHAILAARETPRAKVLRHWGFGVVVALVVLELLAPSGLRPSQLVGDTAAQFYGAIQQMGNSNQLSLEEERILTHMEAERRAEYGAWQGRCAMLMIVDPQASLMCRAAAEAFYAEAIDEVERARRELLERNR